MFYSYDSIKLFVCWAKWIILTFKVNTEAYTPSTTFQGRLDWRMVFKTLKFFEWTKIRIRIVQSDDKSNRNYWWIFVQMVEKRSTVRILVLCGQIMNALNDINFHFKFFTNNISKLSIPTAFIFLKNNNNKNNYSTIIRISNQIKIVLFLWTFILFTSQNIKLSSNTSRKIVTILDIYSSMECLQYRKIETRKTEEK